MQLEAENGTLENVEIAAGAIMMLQAVFDNILGGCSMPVPCGMLHNPS